MRKINIFITLIFAALYCSSQVNEQDSLALVALYNSTDGPNWTCGCNYNWLNSPVEQWQGITVENGRVVKIIMEGPMPCPNCGLNGNIPSEIGNLTALQVMYLSYNDNLSGSIPPEIGQLDSLLDLEISNCNLNGNIPPEIENMSSLENLDISNNQLTGNIPPEIEQNQDLTKIWLGGNELTGTIPSEIGSLLELKDIRLTSNKLTGSIPIEIGNLTNLEGLSLKSNYLIGEIPISIGNLVNLRSLSLSNNQLTGMIPVEIGNLSAIDSKLYLDNNNFYGVIPDTILSISNLRWIQLNNNHFNYIPDFSSLTELEKLKTENNQLQFKCLEPNMPLDTIEEFTYSPQDSINDAMDTTVSINDTIQLTASVSGTANQYQWYHNQNPISLATDSILSINEIQAEDEGLYTCEGTNSLVPDLTLWRRHIHLQVDSSNAINNNVKPFVNAYMKNKTLIIENTDADYQLTVFTTEGRLLSQHHLHKGKTYIIPCNIYPKGMLILRFSNKNQLFTKKIVNH
ncbi:MAG: immunoglobulin domain-containing protein [bacterium]